MRVLFDFFINIARWACLNCIILFPLIHFFTITGVPHAGATHEFIC